MKIGSTVMGMLVSLILVGSVTVVTFQQQASAFGFVESQQIGEFRKLTGEFVQNIITRQQSPNSEGVGQFRILTAQFERDVINAVLNDHLNLIPGITSTYSLKAKLAFGESLDPLDREDIDATTQEVLRIFCRTCF
jgi:hypothetical protein